MCWRNYQASLPGGCTVLCLREHLDAWGEGPVQSSDGQPPLVFSFQNFCCLIPHMRPKFISLTLQVYWAFLGSLWPSCRAWKLPTAESWGRHRTYLIHILPPLEYSPSLPDVQGLENHCFKYFVQMIRLSKAGRETQCLLIYLGQKWDSEKEVLEVDQVINWILRAENLITRK